MKHLSFTVYVYFFGMRMKSLFFIVEESTKNIVKTASMAVGSLKDTEFDIRFNPDVFSPGIRHCPNSDPPMPKQKQLIKDAAEFLLTVQIPTFVSAIIFYNICAKYRVMNVFLDSGLFGSFFGTNGRDYAVRGASQ